MDLAREESESTAEIARDLEAVIFDVGNTLFYLDYERLSLLLANEGLVPRGFSPGEAALAERRARPALSRHLLEKSASTEDPASFRHYLELALARAGLAASADRLDAAFAAVCREHRKQNFFSIPAPGALEAVRALAARFRVAVVSNAGGRVRLKLEAEGFLPHLLAVVDSGLEGVEKPDPAIFLRGCERARVAPARSLYVGDLHAVDVLGARAAGLRAVLLDPAGAYREEGLAGVALVRDVAALSRALLENR
ncbi:HAD family hydrolase [bacterium]|nr:HAD family hydrolase [bacterium]